jgi:hypothetical protein
MNERITIDPDTIELFPDRREVWLLGQPPLDTYLGFLKELALDVGAIPPSKHVDEWRAADDYYAELETSENGIAQTIESFPIDPALQPLADEVAADPRFGRAFDLLVPRFAMVELDKLMVGHPYLNESHKDRLKAKIGPSPSPEALFRFCQPLDRDEAPVQIRKAGSRRYLFWSPSTDFRFQEAELLRPDQAPGYQPIGPLAGIVGLMVGYGSNFLSVIESDKRMLLHNGHHRAYALRDLGITHAPCIVQTVTRVEELRLVATRSVAEDPAFYFASKRPPILKDFFDPKLRKVHRVRAAANVIEVSFEVKEMKQIRDFSDADWLDAGRI